MLVRYGMSERMELWVESGTRLYPPVLFVHMPMDVTTAAKVDANIAMLRAMGVGVGELLLKQRPVSISPAPSLYDPSQCGICLG
jgi:hypothetical protein